MQRNKSFAARQRVKSISERRKFTITQVYILVLAPVSDIFSRGEKLGLFSVGSKPRFPLAVEIYHGMGKSWRV